MFIKEINFTNTIQCFSKDTKISFVNNQKKLIDFYIKNTKKIAEDEKIWKLSDRMQLNCLLWQNGIWKSSLFDEIYNYFLKGPNTDIFWESTKNINITFTETNISENKFHVIYDSFFVWHNNLKNSVNYDTIQKLINWVKLEDFYKNVELFLKKETNKVIFSSFFNIEKDYTYELSDDVFELKNKDWAIIKDISQLSSWEKIMLIRFVNIYNEIYNQYNNLNWKKNFIILIDEPDLHLHLEWQQKYIQRLIDVFSTIKENDITMHFIIATHSPFIISDLPKENIIKLEKNINWKTIQNKDFKDETFWANYIDIIRNWFFKDWVLMWSFSADIIWNIAKNELKAVRNWKEDFEWKELKENIWDDFLRDNLLYFKIGKDD